MGRKNFLPAQGNHRHNPKRNNTQQPAAGQGQNTREKHPPDDSDATELPPCHHDSEEMKSEDSDVLCDPKQDGDNDDDDDGEPKRNKRKRKPAKKRPQAKATPGVG